MSLVTIIASAVTAISMGTSPVEGAETYDWEVAYADAIVETYTTPEPRLEFEPRAGRRFTLRVRADAQEWTEPSEWSTPSYEVVADPLPGDGNFDCVVGLPDYLLVGQGLGTSCIEP